MLIWLSSGHGMAGPEDEVSTFTCLVEPCPAPQPQLAPFSTPSSPPGHPSIVNLLGSTVSLSSAFYTCLSFRPQLSSSCPFATCRTAFFRLIHFANSADPLFKNFLYKPTLLPKSGASLPQCLVFLSSCHLSQSTIITFLSYSKSPKGIK